MSKLVVDPENASKLLENWFEELADAYEAMGFLPDLEVTAKDPKDRHIAEQMQGILKFWQEKERD